MLDEAFAVERRRNSAVAAVAGFGVKKNVESGSYVLEVE